MAIKRLDPISPGRNGTEGQETNAPHLIGLLRPRPSGHAAAPPGRDELAPPLSITSSARPSKAWDRSSVFGFEVLIPVEAAHQFGMMPPPVTE